MEEFACQAGNVQAVHIPPGRKIRRRRLLGIEFLGATGTVTGSRFLVQSGHSRVLVDCGLFQGLKELRLRNWRPLPVEPRSISCVILTHAHLDHSGYLPRLVKEGFRGRVLGTPATVELCKILWPDSARLQEEEAFYANKKGFSRHSPALPLYSEKEAERAIDLLEALDYSQASQLSDTLRISLRDAGHILGSSLLELTHREGREKVKLVFTGDLGRYDSPILRNPTAIRKTDYLVMEATYGNRLHGAEEPEDELVRAMGDTLSRGGVVLIPAFAVGRAQEIIYVLDRLWRKGAVPKVPVYLDSPMAVDTTRLFMDFPEYFDREARELIRLGEFPLGNGSVALVRTREDSKALNHRNGPMIIISASGMATGGRVLHHLTQRLPDARNCVVLVGYQAEGTRGRALSEGAASVKIHGQQVPVRARVEQVQGFSAHADYEEILRWLHGFRSPPEKVFLVHGEPESLRALEGRIQSTLGWTVDIPEYMDQEELSSVDRADGARFY